MPQALNKNYPELVIQRYSSGRFAANEGVVKEYIKVRAINAVSGGHHSAPKRRHWWHATNWTSLSYRVFCNTCKAVRTEEAHMEQPETTLSGWSQCHVSALSNSG
jgi:hypothetical protein